MILKYGMLRYIIKIFDKEKKESIKKAQTAHNEVAEKVPMTHNK